MEDKEKQNQEGNAAAEGKAEPKASQKSDKSPQDLMAQMNESEDSLDGGKKVNAVDAMADDSNTPKDPNAVPAGPPKPKGIKGLLARVNIYLLLFILVLVAAGAAFAVFYFMNKNAGELKPLTSTLTEEDVEQLKTSDAIVGDPSQILTIESNAVITGKLILRDTLDVAGALRIGGPLSIPSISAAGSGTFGTLSTNDLQAGGNGSFGGILDVVGIATFGNNISVVGDINGGGSLDIGGQATIDGNLNVNGTISAKGLNLSEFSLSRINIIGGSNPSVSVGGAAGGGATASVSGSDTAGTITINTGGGTGTGILGTLTFTEPYSSNNPHVVISPKESGCASIAYYVTNVNANQFSIATASNPGAGKACRFNYIVIN